MQRPSTPQAVTRPSFRAALGAAVTVAVVGIVAAALAPSWPSIMEALGETRLRAAGPDIARWLAQPAILQTHVYAALAALAIGAVVLGLPKGSGLHKRLGWTWVIAMATTAFSSLFIRDINGGLFSFIHLFSGWTLVALPMGIYAIRRRNLRGHRAAMGGVFFGGLIVAGALTFIPGRLMWEIFFG